MPSHMSLSPPFTEAPSLVALRTERHVTWHPAFSPPNQQPTCFLRRHWRPLFHIIISLRGSRSGSKATRARRPTSGGRNGPDAVRGACGTQCLASSQSLYENASHQKQTSWVLEPPNPGIFTGFHKSDKLCIWIKWIKTPPCIC